MFQDSWLLLTTLLQMNSSWDPTRVRKWSEKISICWPFVSSSQRQGYAISTVEKPVWASSLAQWIKTLTSKFDALSLIPGLHTTEGRKWFPCIWYSHVCLCMPIYSQTETYIYTQTWFLKLKKRKLSVCRLEISSIYLKSSPESLHFQLLLISSSF